MPFGLFSFYTFLGAGLWSSLLVALGYIMGDKEELIKAYLHELIGFALLLVLIIVVVYTYLHKRKSRSK
jgi:membrane protein DedA with SNARE-associated domain